MVKRPHISTWQRNAEQKLEIYLDIDTGEIDDVFLKHVEYLRSNIDDFDKSQYPPNIYPSLLTQFMNRFGIPVEMKGLMRNYILSDRIDWSMAKPPIAAIDERDNSYRLNMDPTDEEEYWENYRDDKTFKLVIQDGTTTSEIIEFVRQEKEFIDGQLKNRLAANRGKQTPAWVSIRIINLKRNSISNDKIAEKARIEEWPCRPLGPDDIVATYRRSKNPYKNTLE